MSLEAVNSALKTISYPGFSRDIVSFGLVRSVDFREGKALVKLAITTSDPTIPRQIKEAVERTLLNVDGVTDTVVELAVSAPKNQPVQSTVPEPTGVPGIRFTIAVGSGKGGVGKSTIAVNLACAFAQLLKEEPEAPGVGLMDCDIYGPTVPLMTGLSGRPEVEGDSLVPMQRHGLRVMSMGFLVDDETPVVWRGPMIQKTIEQFVQNVSWGRLEVLVVDLPPGTGDAQLSLVQTVPLSGAVIVTTPQAAATNIARKGGHMFTKVNVPLIGVVENLSYQEIPGTDKRFFPYGQGGGEQTAEALGTDLLGQIPLDMAVCQGGDAGEPIVITDPESLVGTQFRVIARKILDRLRTAQQ
ncbi:MAG: chromosome partitioning protein [Verrucomicrobia bacterium]|nr:MAG: chromosome partitioning protein [Verrucomicrobiota bacterium]